MPNQRCPLLRMAGMEHGRNTAATRSSKDALGGCGAWASVLTPLPAVAPQRLPGFHATKEAEIPSHEDA